MKSKRLDWTHEVLTGKSSAAKERCRSHMRMREFLLAHGFVETSRLADGSLVFGRASGPINALAYRLSASGAICWKAVDADELASAGYFTLAAPEHIGINGLLGDGEEAAFPNWFHDGELFERLTRLGYLPDEDARRGLAAEWLAYEEASVVFPRLTRAWRVAVVELRQRHLTGKAAWVTAACVGLLAGVFKGGGMVTGHLRGVEVTNPALAAESARLFQAELKNFVGWTLGMGSLPWALLGLVVVVSSARTYARLRRGRL
jgi:hypothetical protein